MSLDLIARVVMAPAWSRHGPGVVCPNYRRVPWLGTGAIGLSPFGSSRYIDKQDVMEIDVEKRGSEE